MLHRIRDPEPETIRNFTCREENDGKRSILRYDYCDLSMSIHHDSETFNSIMVWNDQNQTYGLPEDSSVFDAKLKDSRPGWTDEQFKLKLS